MKDCKIPPGLAELAYEQHTTGYNSRNSPPQILKVLRYTATQVVCREGESGEKRFNLDTGAERGGNYGSRAHPVTPAVLEGIACARLDGQIRTVAYKLEDLSRKLAHQDRRGTPMHVLESRLQSIKVALIAVEAMLAPEGMLL